MLPRFEIVARHRPVRIVGTATGADGRLALPAPCGAVEVDLGGTGGAAPARVELAGPDGTTLAATWDGRQVGIEVAGRSRRSRRHSRPAAAPQRLALTLTGPQLSALTLEDGAWVVRGRVDLANAAAGISVHDPDWLAALSYTAAGSGAPPRAGIFGQLGLRDVRLVTNADGTPHREDGRVLLTATSAGPGFFATAHTSVWALEADDTLRHRADLFFTRPDRAGVFGDHATHLVRDDGRWLVATSTWADFPTGRRARSGARVEVTLATSTDDLTRGQHVLATRALSLPTSGPSVGVWDPHLVRTDADGPGWLVGYVSARRFFDFHPVVAAGARLDDLEVLGAATDRRASEGTTLHRVGGAWQVLASDGRDNPRGVGGRFPVFDLDLREVATVTAPYPTNIPWPTLVPPPDPATSGRDERWRLVTFNGAPSGGALAGYGTHGDLVIMHETG